MAKKIVTLYIDDTSLRLMVTDGKQIKEWAELPLEPGLIKNTVVIEEAKVVAKIEQLFNGRKVKSQKIILGVSGFHCLTRPITFPELPKAMLNEAVRREARAVLPIPLEQLYMSWQAIPAPEGKTRVFLTAIPCQMADTLLKALHQAGLKPSFMDLKPLLLARVVKETTAVIVDVQTTEFDIVILTDGIPQPVRTISFPDEALPWQEKIIMIRTELDRTITFYNSNNPEKTLASSVPIFVSGELANEPELCQSLSAELGHPVLPLPSPLECPDGLDPSRYLVNIGLALQKLLSGKEAGPSVINVNALPASYQPKPISLINIFGLPGAAIAIGVLVVLVMLIQSTSADIASTRVQFNTTDQLLRQKLSQRQELSKNIAELEKKVTKVEASYHNFTAALGNLEQQSARINQDLEVTLNSLSSSIRLSSISHADNILTINGRALNERMVSSYLKKLDTSGRFSEITITSMSRIEGEGMDFTLLPNLQTPSNGVSSMRVVLDSLPGRIRLNSISSANSIVTITGTSPDEDEILSYLRDLEASGRFPEVTISSLTRIEDGGMDFSLVLKTGE